jgi:hypothetical protein
MLIFIDQGSVEPAGGPAAYAGEVGAGQRPTRDSQFAYYASGVLRLVAWLRALAHCRELLASESPCQWQCPCGSMHEAPT